MKAKAIALCMSLFVSVFPVHAAKDPGAAPAKTQSQTEQINLNTADVETLTHSFKGIGKKRAEAIVAYRKEHPFKSVEDLAFVKGFGDHYIETNFEELKKRFKV